MKAWVLLVTLLVCLLTWTYLKRLWMHRRLPPGPIPLPIIGGLWKIGPRVSQDTFIKMAKDYGNIYTIWLFNRPAIMLCGLDAMKEGLINFSENFSARPVTPFILEMAKGRGIVFTNGHTWKQQRRFGQVAMRKLGLGKKGVEHQIEEEAYQLVESFARAKGQPLDPTIAIINSVSNVVCALVFGHRFSVDDPEFQKLIEAIDAGIKFTGTVAHLMYEVLPSLMKRLPGPQRKVMDSMEMVHSFARKEVAQHKENQVLHDPQDFIDFYLFQMEKSKDDPKSTYNEDNLTQCILDLFVAGTETSATTMQWALLLMVVHPDVQEKVYKEIEENLDSSHSICYQDRKKLPYSNAVIHEIQRSKYILTAGLPRQCIKDTNLGGYLIPEGSLLFPDLRSVLIDPKHWEKPDDFYPEHFLDKDGQFVTKEAFMPFGAGARVCLGEQLAKIELFIFFTSLIRAFRFQMPEGVKELNQEPVKGVKVNPHPYKICAVPRNKAA